MPKEFVAQLEQAVYSLKSKESAEAESRIVDLLKAEIVKRQIPAEDITARKIVAAIEDDVEAYGSEFLKGQLSELRLRVRPLVHGLRLENQLMDLVQAINAHGRSDAVPLDEKACELIEAALRDLAAKSVAENHGLVPGILALIERFGLRLNEMGLSKPIGAWPTFQKTVDEIARQVLLEFHPGSLTSMLYRYVLEPERAAEEDLLDRIHGELVRIARARLARAGRIGRELEPEDLVHEFWMRLRYYNPRELWPNRKVFYGMVVQSIRRLIIDESRRRDSLPEIFDFEFAGNRAELRSKIDILNTGLSVDYGQFLHALDQIKEIDPRQADVLVYDVFLRLTDADIADLMDLDRSQVQRLRNRAFLNWQVLASGIAIDFVSDVDFSEYRSYAWRDPLIFHEAKLPDFESIETRIRKYTDDRLRRLGLSRMEHVEIAPTPSDTAGKTAVHSACIQLIIPSSIDTTHPRLAYRVDDWRRAGWKTAMERYRTRGNFILDLIDAGKNKLVWRAYCLGVLDEPKTTPHLELKPREAEQGERIRLRRIEAAMERAWRDYPPAARKSSSERKKGKPAGETNEPAHGKGTSSSSLE